MKIEDKTIMKRLDIKIVLDPYDFSESLQILKYRSELAFKEFVIDYDHITMIIPPKILRIYLEG